MPSMKENHMAAITSQSSIKLRHCCHSCAKSKVKCSKEKPSCSRCKSRGITCQYFAARKPGRVPAKRSLSNAAGFSYTSNDPNSITRDSIRMSQSPLSWKSGFPSPESTPDTPNSRVTNDNGYFTLHSGPISPSEAWMETEDIFVADTYPNFVTLDGDLYPGSLGWTSDIDAMDYSLLCDKDSGVMQRPNISIEPIMDAGGHLCSEPSYTILSASPYMDNIETTCTARNDRPLFRRPHSAPGEAEHTSCDCLSLALDLLKALSRDRPKSRRTFSHAESPHGTKHSFDPHCDIYNTEQSLIQTVLLENRQTINALHTILAHPFCAHDSFLLTTLSMIILKLLQRYASVAQERTPDLGNESLAIGNPFSFGDQSLQMCNQFSYPQSDDEISGMQQSAQAVLQELHYMQQLVDQLSPQLKTTKGKSGYMVGASELRFDYSDDPITPLSGSTLEHLAGDLHKGLNSLFTELLSVVRQIEVIE